MVCNKCGLDLPLTDYYKQSASPCGYKRICKGCSLIIRTLREPRKRLTPEEKAKVIKEKREEHPFNRESFLDYLYDGAKNTMRDIEYYFGIED